jgi:hypothetical protein
MPFIKRPAKVLYFACPPLELAESLEQLSALAHGIPILVSEAKGCVGWYRYTIDAVFSKKSGSHPKSHEHQSNITFDSHSVASLNGKFRQSLERC